MSLARLRSRFNSLLRSINGTTTVGFSTSVENAFEALTLVTVMNEYHRVYGAIDNIFYPSDPRFLNQKPGKFSPARSFRIDFLSGRSFYFSADVEVFGLEALQTKTPVGIVFEVDVVVIPSESKDTVVNNFNGYPAPQHIHSAYECKFGKYLKGQLRELIGLKRHLCFLRQGIPRPASPQQLFNRQILNSSPHIALKMARPRRLTFLDANTARLYDLEQIIIR